MTKPIQISIPTPCHENWQNMTPEAKGSFCASCQKTVIDFTDSSDREIASILKNQKSACGRFREGQLNRNLILHAEKSSVWLAASAAVFSFMTIGNDVVSAQTPANLEQTDLKTNHIIGDTIVSNERKLITGIVREKTDGAIPGAIITNLNTQVQTQTDINGKFTIEAKKGDKLEVNFVGITSKVVIITSDSNLDISAEMEWMGLIVEPKRTFFGRIFYSIGNLFR